MPPTHSPLLAAPAVDWSIIINREGLGKVSSALATIFNECRRTTAWPASRFSIDRIVTEVQYFADALWAGLVPPFSDFFNAILSHYHIHMMHLGPESLLSLPFSLLFARRWWAFLLQLPCYTISSPCASATPPNARGA